MKTYHGVLFLMLLMFLNVVLKNIQEMLVLPFFLNWQTCALGQSTSVFVHNTRWLSEDQVTELVTNISKFKNKECNIVRSLLT